jgi:predicted acylesterase/phospholipase RssA
MSAGSKENDMTTKALCLSGGATRGSFQVGAIKCLYEAFGFRPDIITGTSVGAINGIKLACAPPPKVNDSIAIRDATASGTVDPQLRHMRELEQFWLAANGRGWFFKVRPRFVGTQVDKALSENTPPGIPLGTQLDLATVGLNLPFIQVLVAVLVSDELQKVKSLVEAMSVEDGVADMSPVDALLRGPLDTLDPNLTEAQRLDRRNVNVGMVGVTEPTTNNLYYGTPLYMATVSLETGRLRYITNRGEFYEHDGATPVATALLDVDIDAALDENLQPLQKPRRDTVKLAVANFKAAVNRIAALHPELSDPDTTTQRKFLLTTETERERQRGIYWSNVLSTQIKNVRIKAVVRDGAGAPDPIVGAIASASLPSLIVPQEIGVERYIDAGLREIIPIDIAMKQRVTPRPTQLVGILCSTPELPAADSKKNFGVVAAGTRALTEIAIHEITAGDLQASATDSIDTRIIAPAFDVHGGMDIHPSEIEISMHYGWMRAADEMQPVSSPEDRDEFRRSSELIARLRLKCLEIERRVGTSNLVIASTQRWDYFELRVNRWAIMHLLSRRNRRGLPAHPRQATWATDWEREFRPTPPLGFASVWSHLVVPFESRDDEDLWPAASPSTWGPDTASIEDAGSDRVYWLVRGAIFEDPSRTRPAPLAHVVVPNNLHQFLPRVPTGAHLMAEQQDPGTIFMVIGGKKYRSPKPAWLAAVGLTAAPLAIVPQGGLMQIPDGGFPYWLGGLYLSDNLRNVIHRWEPTPQIEGSSTTTKVGLTNRSSQPVKVSALAITSSQDVAGATVFTVTTGLPLTVPPGTFVWVDVAFRPRRVETITGTVAVTCDDPDVPQFAIPLATSVIPLGPHGRLAVSPTGFDLGAVRAGRTTVRDATLTNVGDRELRVVGLRIVDASPDGQFAIPFPINARLAPGQSESLKVYCTPSARGRLSATLSVDITSATDTPYPFEQHAEVAMAATAQAPVVFLAGDALPPTRPGGRPPIELRPPTDGLGRVTRELTHLDFGAVAPGTAASRRFWIRNLGDAPMAVTGVTFPNQMFFGLPGHAAGDRHRRLPATPGRARRRWPRRRPAPDL